MKKPERGFSLIELLVVVSLISIMLSIAIPSFSSFISNYRATAAVNDIMQGVVMTRAEAMKRGRKVTMLPNLNDAARTPSASGSWQNGWTVFVDVNNNNVYDSTADTLIYRHGDLPDSTTAAAVSTFTLPFSNNNYVIYDGTGYPRTLANAVLSGGIVLSDRMRASQLPNVRTLCLALYGRPRILQGSNSCTSG